MAELRESSGLHSLASLREHETRRAQQQAEAARGRAEAEQRARQEAARIEHERRLAERAAREYAESAQRAELSRLESAQRAEFERAEGLVRSSTELSSQLESERAARRRLELGLTSRLLRQRLWVSVAVASCVCAGLAVVALYFGALRPSADRALIAAEQSLFAERRARNDAQEREARSLRRADELASRVSSLEQTLLTERERWATQPQPTVPSTIRTPIIRDPHSGSPHVNPCRDDGDPLNPCLKR